MTSLKLTGNGASLKTLALAFIAALAVGSAHADEHKSMPGEGVTVQPAVATWTSAIPVSYVYMELLSELGYNVEDPMSLQNPVAYLAMSEGDVDYWPNGWFPLHNPQLPDNADETITIYEPLCTGCGIQGYLVNNEAIEKYDIEGIMDIADREEVRNAFDHDNDGKAELYGCPPGWGCHEGINAMIDKFELGDRIDHVDAGYAANFTEAMSQIEQGNPALYMTWGPSAWILKLVQGQDVSWVNAPGIVESENEKASGIDGAVTDPINMGFVAADIQVAANSKFLDENPAAKELFKHVRVPLKWISQVDAKMSDQNLDDSEVRPLAAEWIEENRDKVDEWLKAARKAAE